MELKYKYKFNKNNKLKTQKMKKLFLLPALFLFIIGCSNETFQEEEQLSTKQELFSKGGPPCGSPSGYPCLPTNLKVIDTLSFTLGNAMDIVFLSDGFLESEMNIFEAKAIEAMNAFMSESPMSNTNNANNFNFYKINIASPNSGIHTVTTLELPTLDDAVSWDATPFYSYKNKVGLPRYIGIPVFARWSLDNLLIGNDIIYEDSEGNLVTRPDKFHPSRKTGNANDFLFVIIIANDPMFGGGADLTNSAQETEPLIAGSRLSVAIVSLDSNGSNFGNLVVHESAHSIWDLDDEYVDDCGDPTVETPSCGNPPYNSSAYAIKYYEPKLWNYPNRLNTKDTDPGGWFPGSRYISEGKWRSTETSMMKAVNQPFSPLQQQLIQGRIDFETGN